MESLFFWSIKAETKIINKDNDDLTLNAESNEEFKDIDSNDDKLNLSISKTSYFKNHFSERSREQPLFVEKKSHLLEVLGSSYILYIYAVYNSMMTFCRLSSCVLN